MPAPVYWLYIVRRADGALYTGIAVDVAKRLLQHTAGRGAKALRGRGPLQLVLRRRIGDVGAALSLERRFKRLPKARKERLVAAPRRLAAWLARSRLETAQRAAASAASIAASIAAAASSCVSSKTGIPARRSAAAVAPAPARTTRRCVPS